MAKELTEEEVFENDLDPLQAIAAIRREEGASDEDVADLEASSGAPDQSDDQDEGADDDLKSFDEKSESEDETKPDDQAEDKEILPGDTDDTQKGEDDDLQKDDQKSDEEADTQKDEVDDKPASVQKFKANGHEFEFTQEEMNEQFGSVFAKAMDYTQKMQQIAPYRKMISALESEGITSEALNVAIDALKGDTGALKALVEAAEVDPYDLGKDDTGEDYTPNDYGKSNQALDIDDIVSTINKDKEYPITVDVIDNQWDQVSRNEFAKNPGMIAGLHSDIKNGVYDEVAPLAMKMKVLDGNAKSDLEYYLLAGEKVKQEKQASEGKKTAELLNQKAQEADTKFDKASSEADRKRSASSTSGRQDRKGVVDYLNDDNDEGFDNWYKNLMSSN